MLDTLHWLPVCQRILYRQWQPSARLIARFIRTPHISAFMFDHFHWLPLIARIQLKVLTLIYRSHIGQASKYVRDLIRLPSSAISLRPLRSLDHHDLFVPRVRTSMAQTRAFAVIGPLLWNQLLPSTRSTLLTGERSASFRSLKTALFSLGLLHWKRFWLVCTALQVLYKCIDTMQYNASDNLSQTLSIRYICFLILCFVTDSIISLCA